MNRKIYYICKLNWQIFSFWGGCAMSRSNYFCYVRFSRLLLLFAVLASVTAISCCLVSCGGKGREKDPVLFAELMKKVSLADTLINEGDYVHALDSLTEVCYILDKYPEVPDTLKMRTYFLMGKVHSIFDDSQAALKFYKKGLEHRGPDSNPEVVMKLYGNLYQAYAANGDFKSAEIANDSLLKLDIEPDGMKRFLYYFNIADLASRRHYYPRAIEYYRKALGMIDGKEVKERMKVYPYSEMAETYRKMGYNDSAYVNLQRFEQIANADGDPYVMASALRELMFWSARNDNPRMAAEYMERYFAFTDSLIDIRAFLRTKENIRRYEEQTSNGIISDMSESITKGHRVIIVLSIVLLFLGIITVFIIWRSSIIRKNNKFLFVKNEELTKIESKYRQLLLTMSEESREDEHEQEEQRNPQDKESEATKQLLLRIMIKMEREKPYLDPDFSLQTLAEMVDSNTKYVSQAINDITGQNFRNFINEYRIKEAELRLLDTETYGNYTIQWIAESVGIKSKSTFVAAFKKVTGLTPSVYIKLSKEKDKNN